VSHTHTLAEWASMVCMAASGYSAFSVFYFLLVDADVRAWLRPVAVAAGHVKPLLWDVTRSEAVYPLLREWDNAPHAIRARLRDAALSLPALLALLAVSPEVTS
jgi:hypothetical protein